MSQYVERYVFYFVLNLIIITVWKGCVEMKNNYDAHNNEFCRSESLQSRFETHNGKDFHPQVRLCCPEIVYPQRPRP